MSGTISGMNALVLVRSAWASGLMVYPSSSATRRISSRVSALTASGREKALDTVERWTPAAFATTSMLRSAMKFPFSVGLVSTPDDPHDILQLAQRRHAAEACAERQRDLPHERVIQRITVHVDDGALGAAIRCGEHGRSIRVDGREPSIACR